KELPGWGVAGFTLGVIDLNNDKKQTWTAALGLKNASNPTDPINVDSVFHIGSDTKLFTAFTVGHLVDQGKLNWKTPFKTYWPDFKLKDTFSENRANLIDMLSHRMGLSRVGDLLMSKYNNTADMRVGIANLEPSEEFRTSFKYNNHMYMYAGDLVGKLMDQSNPNPTESWMKVVKDMVLKPVGLESAITSMKEFHKLSNAALAHSDAKTYLPENTNDYFDPIAPAGSISMNIKDRLKWIEFLLNKGTTSDGKTILKPKTFQQLFNPFNILPTVGTVPISGVGLAAFISTYKGETVISHGGKVEGSLSKTCFFPDRKFGIVSLYTGLDFGGGTDLCFDVADRLLFKTSKVLKNSIRFISKQKDAASQKLKALQVDFNGRNKDTKPTFDTSASLGEYANPVLGSAFLEHSTFPGSIFQINFKVAKYPPFPMLHFENDRFAVSASLGQNLTLGFKIEQKDIKGFVFRADGFTDDIQDGLYFTKA
ncbi:hypothetical protein HDV02_004072, partial [Globomyces sp. JEL0801]